MSGDGDELSIWMMILGDDDVRKTNDNSRRVGKFSLLRRVERRTAKA